MDLHFGAIRMILMSVSTPAKHGLEVFGLMES